VNKKGWDGRKGADPDSIRSAAKAAGMKYSTVTTRMRLRGMTLEQACSTEKAGPSKGPRPHLIGLGGRNGGKTEPTEDQYFIDCLRAAIGKDPLHQSMQSARPDEDDLREDDLEEEDPYGATDRADDARVSA
jgi:hypothetical protein